jgi:hypothetical protein
MNQLNTLVLPWLEAAGASPRRRSPTWCTTHLHTDHVGWQHGAAGRPMGARPSRRRAICCRARTSSTSGRRSGTPARAWRCRTAHWLVRRQRPAGAGGGSWSDFMERRARRSRAA